MPQLVGEAGTVLNECVLEQPGSSLPLCLSASGLLCP